MAISRNTAPTSEEITHVDARLHKLLCNACLCSSRTLADRLRRDGAQPWVCKRAVELTCDACESRKPPQPRNRATFEYGTKPRSQDGLDYVDLTLESHKTVANVLVMVEAASQMAVTAVLFVRTDGKHRKATAAGTTSLFENAYVAHYPRPVAVRFDPEGCVVSRGWSEALAGLDCFSTQLGDVERQSKH